MRKIFRIFQLPHNNRNLFRSFGDDIFNRGDYCCVWWGDISLEEDPDLVACENIFREFNCDLPEHFAGHSMSVSDIIEFFEVDDDGNRVNDRFYFCDSFGFKKISYNTKGDFWKDN